MLALILDWIAREVRIWSLDVLIGDERIGRVLPTFRRVGPPKVPRIQG